MPAPCTSSGQTMNICKPSLGLLATAMIVSLAACAQPTVTPTPIPVAARTAEPAWLQGLPASPWPSTCEGYVNLSFDDGPTVLTRDILAVLDHYQITASFFTLGVAEEKNARLVSDIVEKGHQIGNHTYSHSDLTTLDAEAAAAEMANWTVAHRDLGYDKAVLFRPPYGATSPELRAIAEEQGMVEALWTVDSKDFDAASPEAVLEQSFGMTDGGILLLHDGREATVEALPSIIKHYHDQNLCFGPIAATDEELPTDTAVTHRARAVSR